MDKSQFIVGVDYDERLLKNRITTEGNVCGALLKDLTYYDDCGLESKDFLTRHGRTLFTIGEQIRAKGLSHMDEITFISNCSEELREKVEEELGGWKQIQNVIDAVSTKNWDGYLDELNKANICIALYNKNFNLLEEMTLDNGKKVVPIKLFEKFTSAEVIDFYESQLSSLDTKINSSKIVAEGYIDFDDDWVQSLADQEEVGVSFGYAGEDIAGNPINTFKFMSNEILGLKPGTLNCWAAHSGCGKTTYMVGVAMSLISQGQKVIMVTNESSISDLKQSFLVWVLYRCLNYDKIGKKKLASGNLTEEDMKMIRKARDWYRKKYAKAIKIVALSDADCNLSCQIIKTHIKRDGCTAFIVDTFKLSVDNGSNDSFWMDLVKDTRKLTSICLKENVIGLMTMQLALSSINRCWLNSDCLSNSKAVKEVLSNLIMFRKAADCELDPLSPYYIKPFRSRQREDGVWIEEPYEPDRTKVWRIFWIDKSRRGPDSNDTQVCYLSRFDGSHASFFETAKCRPTHKILNNDSK